MPIPTWPITCGHCGRSVGAEVVAIEGYTQQNLGQLHNPGQKVPDKLTLWIRCPTCKGGSVKTAEGDVFPSAPAGRLVAGLSPEVEQAWREGRSAHAVAAYTAAEMVFRKILMHVAVDKAGSAPGRGFIDYVNDLESGGYITTGLKGVVDQVRKRGNTANHELSASTERDSLLTMTITEHLLEGLYELPAMVALLPPPATSP
jgi:hypothetical protein